MIASPQRIWLRHSALRTAVTISLLALLGAPAARMTAPRLAAQGPAAPGSLLKGRVRNGTTNKDAANVMVQYVQLSQGMTPIESVQTDGAGNFQFTKVPAPGTQPAGPPGLLRVEYQGATYSQPVGAGMPGQDAAAGLEVMIFEASRDRELMAVREHAIFVRPSGNQMAVLEQIFVDNASAPPRAYVNPDGTYRFTLPAAPRGEVTATLQGAAGMPIPQTPKPDPSSSNTYTINYPIRPGESIIRLQYQVDYTPPFDLSKPLDRLPEQVHVVTPDDSVKVESENMIPAGKDEASGFAAFLIQPVGNRVIVRITGEAPPDQVSASPEQSGALTPIPNPLHGQRWILFGGFAVLLLAGFVYLYKKG